jgi:L-lactate dehydrogenase complex protein LldE
LGVQGEFPKEQICCGQPFFNSGYRSQARDLAVIWLKLK